MDQGFINILKQLVREQSSAALTDAKKCKAFLADYTKNEYKKESRLILLAVEAGMAKVIDGADELEPCKKAFIRDLEEEGLSSTFAADIINTLALVLRGDMTETQSPRQTAAPTAPVAANAPCTDSNDDFGMYDGSTPPKTNSSTAAGKTNSDASHLFNKGQYAEAIAIYRALAEQGDTQAMRNIAYNYRIGGCGLPQDNNKAIEWYTKAVNLGDKYAKTSLETLRRYISAGPSLPTSPTDLTGSVWHETTGDFHFDYTFMGNGILWYKGDEDGRHTWAQNGNTVTLNKNDNYGTYKLQKVDPDTLEGTFSNIDGYTCKASFKRGSNRK